MKGIPPGPKSHEKVDVLFDLDANGILSVSATSQSTGNTESITIDANIRDRLSAQEIDKLVEKAEKMKFLDEEEEDRVLSFNRLGALGNHIKLEAKNHAEKDVKELLQKVDESASWLRENPSEKKATYNSKYEDLYSTAVKVISQIKSSEKKISPTLIE